MTDMLIVVNIRIVGRVGYHPDAPMQIVLIVVNVRIVGMVGPGLQMGTVWDGYDGFDGCAGYHQWGYGRGRLGGMIRGGDGG